MNGPTIPVGEKLGRFRIEGKAGSGGMGDVYRAIDTRLGRTVALKVLPAHLVSRPDLLARFEQEARAASALNDPNIVTVYDAGADDGVPWIAMEYVQGQTLRKLLRDAPLDGKALQELAPQIARALAAAHEAGIVHRDLKPENVMVGDGGSVKILDFGLAKLSAAAATSDGDETQLLTNPGEVFGTPGYIAPEQIRGHAADHRVDQFAFGVMLYEMAVGKNPFKRDSTLQTTAATLEEEPTLDALPSDTPSRLSDVIGRCLAKNPERRYHSTRDLVADLSAEAPARRTPGVSNKTRRKLIMAAVAAVVIAAGAVAIWRAQPKVEKLMPVVAVRPFTSLSGDASQEHFTNGMAEELRGQLSKISSIRLLSRSAVERYRGADTRKLASELRASQIVDGSVRIYGGNLRVSVQLVDARTDQTLWAEQYDRRLEDIFAVQSDVARQMVAAMQTTLTPDERRRVGKRSTENVAAYDLLLQARKVSSPSRDAAARSASLLKQAIDMDPKFTEAMAELGYRLAWLADPGQAEEARRWAERALAIDPESSQAHHALALVHAQQGFFNKARVALLRALEVDPNRSASMNDLSLMMLATGHLEEGLHWARMAVERDPTRPAGYYHVMNCLWAIGRRDAMEKWYDLFKGRYPEQPRLAAVSLSFLILRGETGQALQQARELYKAKPSKETLQVLSDTATVAGAPDGEQLLRELHLDELDAPFVQWWMFPQSPRVRYARFALKRGDDAAAGKLLADAEKAALAHWDRGVDTAFLPIELASIYAIRKDAARAMEWINRAYDRGWRDDELLRLDPHLAHLRTVREYQKVIERIAAERKRVGQESTEIRHLFEKTVPALPPVKAGRN